MEHARLWSQIVGNFRNCFHGADFSFDGVASSLVVGWETLVMGWLPFVME